MFSKGACGDTNTIRMYELTSKGKSYIFTSHQFQIGMRKTPNHSSQEQLTHLKIDTRFPNPPHEHFYLILRDAK